MVKKFKSIIIKKQVMKNTPYYFTLFLLLALYSCSFDEEVEFDENGKAMCGSVGECLAIYDFERARKFVDDDGSYEKDENLKSITIAESKYWADNGDIDKALTVIDESWGISEYAWSEADWQSWRYNIIDKGVATLCDKSEFKQAKGLALKAADDINVDGQKIGESTGGGWQDKKGNTYYSQSRCEDDGVKPCSEIKAKGPSMQETLLKKISKYEAILK
jgi:hypothetical protein